VNRLAAAGLPRIEAARFVRPDAVPQMAGAEEVVEAIRRRAGIEYSGLARSSMRHAAGLGGCPYAPRATGNVATEDLVYLLPGVWAGA
jgi:hypothetical protein